MCFILVIDETLVFQVARKVRVEVESVFRGVKRSEPVEYFLNSGLPDYSLVPKHLEKNYKAITTDKDVIEKNILPRYTEFPPLLRYMMIKNGAVDPKLDVQLKKAPASLYRVAKDGEKPTKTFETGFGTPKNKNLVKHVDYNI